MKYAKSGIFAEYYINIIYNLYNTLLRSVHLQVDFVVLYESNARAKRGRTFSATVLKLFISTHLLEGNYLFPGYPMIIFLFHPFTAQNYLFPKNSRPPP